MFPCFIFLGTYPFVTSSNVASSNKLVTKLLPTSSKEPGFAFLRLFNSFKKLWLFMPSLVRDIISPGLSAFSHKNSLNFLPLLLAKNFCVVGPSNVFLTPLTNPACSKLFISSNVVNTCLPLRTLLIPNVARAVGSKNNCAAASITPVIMLYASVPGSTILSKGLKKYEFHPSPYSPLLAPIGP